MPAIRRAEVTWEGDLKSGKGVVSAKSSGAFKDQPVTWAARTEEPNGKTSPEELVAAAHASCFAMAFSSGLAKAGKPAQKLSVTAAVTFDQVGGGWKVKSSELEVVGWVQGIDADAFNQAAQAAKEGCPISQALKGNVDIQLKARLA
jgi:lipoyl-dependent peroxiredoxin